MCERGKKNESGPKNLYHADMPHASQAKIFLKSQITPNILISKLHTLGKL